MDCLHAQSLISEALDRAPVDADALEQAKQHCRSCPECGAFVSALAAIQRTPAPEPPAELAGRIMDTLAIEIARERALQSRTPADEAIAAAAAAHAQDRSSEPIPLRDRLTDPRARRSLALWGSVAAVVLLAAGFGAVAGVRQITAPTESRTAMQYGTEDQIAGTAPEANLLAEPAPEAGDGAQDKSATVQAAPGFIMVNGDVYRFTTVESTAVAGMSRIGTTRSALDAGGTAASHDVFAVAGQTRVFVRRTTDDSLLAFEPVTRAFRGITYQLQSAEIAAFGDWPTLPATIPQPAQEDGGPTFTYVDVDSNGTKIYRLTSSAPAQGIAVAPGTQSPDPAGGNPGWTWWTPAN